jgi:hypothetical protein
VGRNLHPGNQVFKFSHAKLKPRLPKFPLGVIASQPLYHSISRKIPTDNTKQTTSPGTQLLPLLTLPHLSCPSILVASRFTIHKSERPERPDLPTSEAPIQKVHVKLSHARFLPLPRHLVPASLLHQTLLRFSPRATTFAPSLLLLSHSFATTQLHQASIPYPGADHLLRQRVYAPRNCRHG